MEFEEKYRTFLPAFFFQLIEPFFQLFEPFFFGGALLHNASRHSSRAHTDGNNTSSLFGALQGPSVIAFIFVGLLAWASFGVQRFML
jgi:hypothetical protein